MNHAKRVILLAALLQLRDTGPDEGRYSYGICYNAKVKARRLGYDAGLDEYDGFRIGEIDNELSGLFKGWPKHSGDDSYPVPNPHRDDLGAARDAYDTAWGEMWDERNPYGVLRRELLQYTIEKLQRELDL